MIRLKISSKLFGAFFLILVIVVAAIFLSRLIFSYNFQTYINQTELEKLQGLAPTLAAEYRARQGWQGIRDDVDHWQSLLDQRSDIRKNHQLRDKDPGRYSTRILLADEKLEPIIGQPDPEDQRQLVAIEVDGKTVGWLGLKKRRPFRVDPPAALADQMAKHLSLLALAVVVLTAIIALLLSRHLLKPIGRLTEGTRSLAARDFSVRIEPCSRDELGELAENFNSMAQTLDRYEKMRRQWLTDISHELRTPLAVLRGEIEAIQDGIREASPVNLASLHAEVLRISKLVEDLHLLSLAESDSLSLKMERVPVQPLLHEAEESYRTRLHQRGITVDMQDGGIDTLVVRGDSGRLDQVFTNILENVCKYVESPGRLTISGRRELDQVQLVFEDSGPGVPAAALPRLFDRLYRLDGSRSRDTGGSGLGLSICRHIIELHGGTIDAEAGREGGLAIIIRLPLADNTKADENNRLWRKTS